MQDYSKVPIKNIYFMLCYSWDRLKEKDHVTVSQEEDKDIYHLLTRVLLKSLSPLIKRGFYREYLENNEETSTLRSKIQFQQSINTFSFKRAKMHCQFDELSHNILHNQLIKTTLYYLLQNKQLDTDLKEKVHQLYSFFQGVQVIKITKKQFNDLRLHRSNQHYGFVLDICRLLYDNLLINEENSEIRFIDFQRDHHAMANLFEKFVKNFYKKESAIYKVYSENISWEAAGEDISFLPKMQTDISLESNNQKIIMDTKFYHNALAYNHDTEKLISGNLYQLYAYLSNYKNEKNKAVTGILLYPKVKNDLDLNFQVKSYQVKVCTIDMNRNWQYIHERLLEVVGECIGTSHSNLLTRDNKGTLNISEE